MEPRSTNETGSSSISRPEDWRNPRNLEKMSISELFHELRDTFRSKDFDLVQETLISREKLLKDEIEQKNKELELSEERTKFEKLERVTLEFKMEKLQAEMNKKALMKKNGNGRENVVAAVKNRIVGDNDGGATASAGAIMAKEKKRDEEPCRKDRLHASVVTKRTLKEAVEEKVLGKLKENDNFKSWGRIDVGIEVNTTTGKKRRREELTKAGETGKRFCFDDGKVMKVGVEREKCKLDVLKNRGFGDGEATATVGEKVDDFYETLVVRDVVLKSTVEETVGELEENNDFKNLGRINYETDVKTVVGERWEFDLDNGKFVKAGVGNEKSKFEVLKNRGVGDGEALAPAELAGEKVKVLAEKKRFVGASDTKRKSSSGAVQKNLDTRLAKPIAIPPGDAMRKAAIAEKIRLLQKKNQFECPGRLNFDGEGGTVNGESCGEKLIKVGENADEKAVNAKLGHERCKLEVLKNSGVGDGEASAVGQKVEVLAEKKRLAGEPSKKDDLGSSDKKQKNSSGAVQENPATKLVGSIGIKKDFPFANMNFLDGIVSSDSSSSSSDSSSDEFDIDIPPLTSLSNKKMRIGK